MTVPGVYSPEQGSGNNPFLIATMEIEAATRISRARHDQLFKAVDLLQRRAEESDQLDISLALLQVARDLLKDAGA